MEEKQHQLCPDTDQECLNTVIDYFLIETSGNNMNVKQTSILQPNTTDGCKSLF